MQLLSSKGISAETITLLMRSLLQETIHFHLCILFLSSGRLSIQALRQKIAAQIISIFLLSVALWIEPGIIHEAERTRDDKKTT